MRISLFISCFNDTLFPQTGQAVVALLERLGHTIDFPMAQTCCGQMHNNSGYGADATTLMRRHLDVFEHAGTVVCPSSSCVATIRKAYPRLAAATTEPLLEQRARDLAGRTFELSEFIVNELGLEDVGAYYPHRVTYHPTCNSLRGLDLGDTALRLLAHVRGMELVELPRATECCGFGGTFAFKNADTSIAMLTDKLTSIRFTQAEVCTALDNSCLMHIAGGLSRRPLKNGQGLPLDVIFLLLEMGVFGAWVYLLSQVAGLLGEEDRLYVGLVTAVHWSPSFMAAYLLSQISIRPEHLVAIVAGTLVVSCLGIVVSVAGTSAPALLALCFAAAGLIAAQLLFLSVPTGYLIGVVGHRRIADLDAVGALG